MAQTTITPDVLSTLRKSQDNSSTAQALRNAISANDIRTLALNQNNLAEKSTYFSNSVNSKGITDQKSSGRCWLFSGLNVLRAKVIAKNKLNSMEFSQNYLFFYDQLEKANLFLQGVIDNYDKPMDSQIVTWLFQHPINDGGTFAGVADLTAKYGIVPKGVMPETYNSDNTSRFSSLLERKLREDGILLRESAAKGVKAKALETQKVDMLKTVYRMLTFAFGVPPTTFTWAAKDSDGKYVGKPKEYTPQTFYQTFIGDDLNANYVMLMNDPSRPYNKVYEIDFDRHTYDGHNWRYLNLPIDSIKQIAIASIKDSTMMYFSCDVGKDLNRDKGLLDVDNYNYGALFGTTFGMNKKQRIESFDSGSTHAMTLMAVDIDENGRPVKWEVENSWGATNGFNGHLIMTDRWFDEYMFRLVANRKYVSQNTLNLLKQKPIRLPAWDPMFSSEE
jgi:bleomycin hydrolase